MPSHKVVMAARDQDMARTLSGALSDLVEPLPGAVTAFESGDRWIVEAYYAEHPDRERLAQQLGALLPFAVPQIEVTEIPDENWVAISQAALPPVSVARFTIHGSHHRGVVPQGPNTLLIDAGEAFGTAHHATTQGCLLALDRATRRYQFENVLDLGCGSGVLAIAAARALPRARIDASDNDPVAISVARRNARLNGVGGRVRMWVADGLPRNRVREGSYDLILANILADPLVALAQDMARAVRPGGVVILSGLLVRESERVIAAYRSHGFSLVDHRRIAGWSTLTLVKDRKGAARPFAQPKRAA